MAKYRFAIYLFYIVSIGLIIGLWWILSIFGNGGISALESQWTTIAAVCTPVLGGWTYALGTVMSGTIDSWDRVETTGLRANSLEFAIQDLNSSQIELLEQIRELTLMFPTLDETKKIERITKLTDQVVDLKKKSSELRNNHRLRHVINELGTAIATLSIGHRFEYEIQERLSKELGIPMSPHKNSGKKAA